MTMLCVPIAVRTPEQTLADAAEAKALGADIVEFRVDEFFNGESASSESEATAIVRTIADAPLPVILTCRIADEGGAYDGPEDARVSLFERVATGGSPPAYLDVELAAYTRSANFRQKVNLCVSHAKQVRDVPTRLILSSHDFQTRPADLSRRIMAMYAEPACAVAKIAFRARSLRDNVELFELLRGAPKPTIALGMGEFGLMSRVLAPKFGGLLTFASLRRDAATAPGQATIREMLDLYRFRSIQANTKVYGVLGWPVAHSMSPLVHNAGFEAVGHDGVYLPMPVAGGESEDDARASFKATVEGVLRWAALDFAGASVTIPFKSCPRAGVGPFARDNDGLVAAAGAANTIVVAADGWRLANTDLAGIVGPLRESLGELAGQTVVIWGAGGAARAAALGLSREGADVRITNRTVSRSEAIAASISGVRTITSEDARTCRARAHINTTPIGMHGGPAPEAMAVPIDELAHVSAETVFFDTVYNPIETPMLKAARARGCRTIDGVRMFGAQAAAQFELWTGKPAPKQLFDRLVRETLGG
ncbi:MAG: type I 3-dehydroquinate dehydratase [Phycisphaerales bacterium]|nr:MAG: type I 3-dehydroquinate dehydratase [Phycisphaerales bacterium]